MTVKVKVNLCKTFELTESQVEAYKRLFREERNKEPTQKVLAIYVERKLRAKILDSAERELSAF